MNNEIFALCSPIIDNYTKGYGTICIKCCTPLWLSDTTISAVINQGGKSENISPICISCCADFVANEKEDVGFIPPSNEQISEIKNVFFNDDLKKNNQEN